MTVETKTVLDGLEPVNLQRSLSFGEPSLEPDKPRHESWCITDCFTPRRGCSLVPGCQHPRLQNRASGGATGSHLTSTMKITSNNV